MKRHLGNWTVLIGLVSLSLACERKSDDKEAAPSTPPAAHPPQIEQPAEQLRLDPDSDARGAPWGGLRVEFVGTTPDEARHLVVLFHGYGARGDDLAPFASALAERVPASYVLPEAPFALDAFGGRAWFRRDRSNFTQGLAWARRLVSYVEREFPEADLVVGGFSQGAMLTANLLDGSRARLRGALIFSPADLLQERPTAQTPRVPVLMSHGTRDMILPFAEGVRLRDRLQGLGFDVTWVEFVGRHQIPPVVLDRTHAFLKELFETTEEKRTR